MSILKSNMLQGISIEKTFLPTITPNAICITGAHNNVSPSCFSLTKDILSRHMLFIGGTGCGKTNAIFQIVDQIKNNMTSNDVMIIFDTKGDYYSRFFSSSDMVIANSDIFRNLQQWNIYREILSDGEELQYINENISEISYSFFKEATEKTQQIFFPNAARDILESIIKTNIYRGLNNRDYRNLAFYNESLKNQIDNISVPMLQDAFSSTKQPSIMSSLIYLGNGDSDQSLGVLSELQCTMKQLLIGKFAEKGGFSIKQFVRNKGGRTLFVEYDLSVGQTLTPIYRLLFDLALKESMGRNRSIGNVYFVVDEFKLLPNLAHIEDAVNFGRGLGVKVIAGIQSVEQLYEVYGENRGKNIAAGFSSIFAFRTNDKTTREYISNLYGQNMVLEQYQTSMNTVIEEKRIGQAVEDWHISGLKIGEAIIGLSNCEPFKFKFNLFR